MQIGYRPHQNRSTYFASAARGPICSAPYHSPLASAGDRASISPIAQMLMMFSGGSLLGSLVAPGQNQAPVQASPQFGRRAQSAPTTTGTGSLDQLGPSRYDNLIREAAAKYDMDPALIKAVIKKESSFNPSAGSSAGAQGLMQLIVAKDK